MERRANNSLKPIPHRYLTQVGYDSYVAGWLIQALGRTEKFMKFLSQSEARHFAENWLPAWSGNNPELLASFYSDDALYLDPGVPKGIAGKPALLVYFTKLLSHNPEWVWSQIEGIPLEGGFLNKWLAKIPVGTKIIEVVGVCFVQLDSAGKIRRNEVYFDRSELLAEIATQRAP